MELLSPGPVADIGAALIARLTLAFPPEKFTHEFIPAKLDGSMWTRLLRRTPFVGLGFAGLAEGHGGADLFNGTSEWVVFLVTKNERGPFERFFGDELAPGALQMMQTAIGALQGLTIIGHGSVGVSSAANSYAEEWKDDALAMIQLSLTVRTAFSLRDVVKDIPAAGFASTSITWSFNGGQTIALTEINEGNT